MGLGTRLISVFILLLSLLAAVVISLNMLSEAREHVAQIQAVLVDDMDAKKRRTLEMAKENQNYYSRISSGLLLACILVAIFGYFHFRRHFLKPLLQLSEAAKLVSSGQSRDHVSVKTDDEIGELAGSFNAMSDRLVEVTNRLGRLSSIDSLTQVPNRRFFDEVLETEWKRWRRSGDPLSLVLLDIDFFKQFNDTAGHQAGDNCLKQVAAILSSRVRRSGDLLARYGGEEFVLLLPNTDTSGAYHFAEELRSSIEQALIPHPGTETQGIVTISLGVANLAKGQKATAEDLISMADAAMYGSKRAGRNRVTQYQPGN